MMLMLCLLPLPPGPETVDHAMLGTTRSVDPHTNAIEWTRPTARGARSVIFRMHPEREGGRLIFQIGSSDPDRAVEAARTVAADVVGVDVNAGCPKPFSTSGGMGAALLRTPDRLCAILEALVRHIAAEYEIGISVKIRLLEDPAETEALVRRLVATGITGLTVHCRFPPTRPREAAKREQLRMVAGICRDAGVACLMNGDVFDRDGARALVDEYGVDGAMIATAAEKNPSCFRGADDGGLAPWDEVVHRYLRTSMEVGNRFSNTKYLLVQMIPGKKMPKTLHGSRDYTTACESLGLDDLAEQAKETDALYAARREEDYAGVEEVKKAQKSESRGGGGQKKRKAERSPARQRSASPVRDGKKPRVEDDEASAEAATEATPVEAVAVAEASAAVAV
jgi:tRNA-dihydrouridine synthase 2